MIINNHLNHFRSRPPFIWWFQLVSLVSYILGGFELLVPKRYLKYCNGHPSLFVWCFTDQAINQKRIVSCSPRLLQILVKFRFSKPRCNILVNTTGGRVNTSSGVFCFLHSLLWCLSPALYFSRENADEHSLINVLLISPLKHVYVVVTRLFFPRQVLTRSQRLAAECGAERNADLSLG